MKNKKIWMIMIIVLLFVFFFPAWYIGHFSAPFIHSDPELLPDFEVGLLPGTSRKLQNGRENLFYKYRIDAASELFKMKKIKYILVSGDNSSRYYNEPHSIRQDLILRGVPDRYIYMDYAGFRTLDTVIRARQVFGIQRYIFISQPFHNERAVFLARYHGIEAEAYNAKMVSLPAGFKTRLREYFARIAAFLDVFILHTSPKFLGEPVIIGDKK